MKAIQNLQLKMKNCGLWFLIFNFAFLIFNCLYADINIEATVDRNTVNFGDSITLQVTVSGDVANIPKPVLPSLADFNVYSSGTSQNISFVNGKVSSSLIYNFILSPNKPGKFTIAPVTLTVGGKTYSTVSISVEVLASAAPQIPQQSVSPQPVGIDENVKEIFVAAELNKKKVFVNEGIIYTFRFYTSRNLYSNPEYNPPNFTGFIIEDLPPQKNYQTILNGKRYNVIEIKTELYPTTPGIYNLGAASLRANIQDFAQSPFGGFADDDFFKGFFGGGKSVTVKSKPLTVEILPLPSDNKPSNFSGAVGNYQINVSADKTEVEANNPITISVTISGEGNIKSIPEPEFPNIVGVRKYDTVSSVNISKSNYKVSGSKTFKTVVVPEHPGNLIIPESAFSFFNPGKKEYQKAESSPFKIKVLPSKTSAISHSLPLTAGVNIVGQDICFVKTDLGKVKNYKIEKRLADLFIMISILVLLFSVGYNGYSGYLSKNYLFVRSRRAFKKFKSDMKVLNKNDLAVKDFYGRISELIIKYLSDKTVTPLFGCTFTEIERVLIKNKLSADKIEKIKEVLERADFIRFAPQSDKNVDFKKAFEETDNLISEIERVWKI